MSLASEPDVPKKTLLRCVAPLRWKRVQQPISQADFGACELEPEEVETAESRMACFTAPASSGRP